MIFPVFQKKWVFGYSWSTLLWYRCYYPHWSRDALSPVYGIFFVLVLLSASVERCFVSRMRDFFYIYKSQNIQKVRTNLHRCTWVKRQYLEALNLTEFHHRSNWYLSEAKQGTKQRLTDVQLRSNFCVPEVKLRCNSDMENVRNFTQAGLFVSRFYPKVRELRKFWDRDKTAYLSANTMFTTFTSLHHVHLIITKKS